MSAPACSGRRRGRRHAAREPRRGHRLQIVAVPVEGVALGDVRLGLDLAERQHRRHAGVGVGEDLRPVVAVLGGDGLGDRGAQLGPAAHVVLVGQVGTVEAQPLEHLGVELRLDRADRDVPAVGAGVGVVVRGAAVEHVDAALVGPHAVLAEAPDHLRQHARAVDHRGIDHLALARGLPLPQRGEDADEQEHRPAAEVAGQVQRRDRPFAGAADRVQHAVERDVVDVVSGLQAPRPGLAPPRHAAVDQPLVDLRAVFGSEAESLGDAGPQSLDQDVGLGDQLQDEFTALVGLEVRGHRAAVAQGSFAFCRRDAAQFSGPLDAHDVGAEIAEDHRSVRTWADAGQFDDAQSVQWSRHAF